MFGTKFLDSIIRMRFDKAKVAKEDFYDAKSQ